jgi:hypothetical protein
VVDLSIQLMARILKCTWVALNQPLLWLASYLLVLWLQSSSVLIQFTSSVLTKKTTTSQRKSLTRELILTSKLIPSTCPRSLDRLRRATKKSLMTLTRCSDHTIRKVVIIPLVTFSFTLELRPLNFPLELFPTLPVT